MNKLLIVTFPRSGHHLLVGMLQKYFGPEMVYCETYEHCNTIPCPNLTVNVQKTHDFDLDVAAPDGWKVLVQMREPLPAIVSWYETQVSRYGMEDSRRSWDEFFAEKMHFYVNFYKKWAHGNHVIFYEELIAEPCYFLRLAVSILIADPNNKQLRELTQAYHIFHKRNFLAFKYLR